MEGSDTGGRIRITGWTDKLQFQQYLEAVDVGVQLRTLSRGETSAAVLDCMNHALPTIVNANGSMADLPADAVWMLPDEFENTDLIAALTKLWQDKTKRQDVGCRAREVVLTRHAPRLCATQYAKSVEIYYARAQESKQGLFNAIAKIPAAPTNGDAWLKLAKSVSENQPPAHQKQLFVDISELVKRDAKTGVQRVVRSVLWELLTRPPSGFRIEPVYATQQKSGYRYARQFTLQFLNCPDQALTDAPVEIFNGDIFLGLDLQPHVVPEQTEFYAHLRRVGVSVHFVVYDLLPVLMPHVFFDGAAPLYSNWLRTIAQADGILCISRSVADEMYDWLAFHSLQRLQPLKISWFHLGADLVNSVPTTGLPEDSINILKSISAHPTFLMVGTLEPRKGLAQTLAAFEQLWQKDVNINLVLVGKQGWMVEALVSSIENNQEFGQRLFWLSGISDEYLECVYENSSCLIAASNGEGFGLPLVEAAEHNIPIIARDIPVFREIAGNHAFYFHGSAPQALADAICEWLVLAEAENVPTSSSMPRLTWSQSTDKLLESLLHEKCYRAWMSDGVWRYHGSDLRLATQVGTRNGQTISTTFKAGHLIFGPYLTLDPGRYQVSVHGKLGENCQQASVDVVMGKGACVLAKADLRDHGRNLLLAEVLVPLDFRCVDFEVRVWVDEKTILNISMIEIALCKDILTIGNDAASQPLEDRKILLDIHQNCKIQGRSLIMDAMTVSHSEGNAPSLIFSEQASLPILSVPPALKKDGSTGRNKLKYPKK
jgi:glycosyltransferase involved in cell wall biosynthesis